MTILLVDIGNTRVKWASLERGRVGPMKAAAHKGWDGERIARHVLGAKTFERLVVVSVAGVHIDRAFTEEVRRRLEISPEFFRSERRAGGVTTMYSEPWRLGADRLAGVIGAFHLSKHRPVCVVGVGTTMTLDFVDGNGRHRGGAIAPAPALMVDSLLWGNSRYSTPRPGREWQPGPLRAQHALGDCRRRALRRGGHCGPRGAGGSRPGGAGATPAADGRSGA